MENNPEHEKILQQICDFAIYQGYISTYDICHVLAAENLKYDFQALIKRFGINTRLLPKQSYDSKEDHTKRWKDNDVIPEDCVFFIYDPPSAPPFEKRRGYWYYIILRLVSGRPGTWKDEFPYVPESQGNGHMPIYKYTSEIGKFELVSDDERKEQQVESGYLKLEDIHKWFSEYLKLPLPQRLFPENILKDSNKKRENDFTIPVPDGTQWGQIKFRYVNDSIVQIFYPGGNQPFSSTSLGLADKPVLFKLFKLFARSKGTLSNAKAPEKVKANVSNLRKHLKGLFLKISGKPIGDYDNREGWRCNFQIDCYEVDSDSEPQKNSDLEEILSESQKIPAKSKPKHNTHK